MKKKTLALFGAGALALGIAAPVAAYATDDDRSSHRQEFAAALAKELGVEESKVTETLDKLREERRANAPEPKGDRSALLKERLDQAVADGTLTQAEADAVLKAYEAGIIGGPSRHGGPRGGKGGPSGQPS